MKTIGMACLTLALVLAAAAAAAPQTASASCEDRKVTGTVLGGIGGALIGNSISRGGGGAVLGGLGGAVVGHEVAGAGCRRYRAERYYRHEARHAGYREGPSYAEPVRYVYYDQFGNPVAQGPVVGGTPVAYTVEGPCRTEMQTFYDERAALVQRPVQVCAR
jgi:hypothetical protein